MMLKPINLQLGWPSTTLFPTSALHHAATTTLTTPSISSAALVYGPDPGHQALRTTLATWLTNFYVPRAGPIPASHMFITNGASGSLGTILAKFTDPGVTRRVFMIEPTYFLACPILEDAGFEGRLMGVPEDEGGVDVEFLRRALEDAETECDGVNGTTTPCGETRKSQAKYPKLYRYVIYAVPTFSNPSGKVMSLAHRTALVKLAREFDALLITDDVYDMLRWPVDPDLDISALSAPPPRLCDIDRALPGQTAYGNAVSNGSFSKLAAPGVRVGWAEGTEKFVETLATHGATKSGGSPGHMASVFMNEMVGGGGLDRHIQEVLVPAYRKRWGVLMAEVERELVPLGCKVEGGKGFERDVDSEDHAKVAEAGGFFAYTSLPDDLPAAEVAKVALELYSLKFAHGGMMLASGDAGSVERARSSFGKGVRLSWSWHDEDEIREGVRRLAQVMMDMRAGTLREKELGRDGASALLNDE